jgi:hypothetical protein
MRDKRFKAVYRGGLLCREQHIQLIKWACDCAENVLPLTGEKTDKRLEYALLIAKEWVNGKATVGDARKASMKVIAAANESSEPVVVAVARSVGHAVATAHMSDHSLGAALYALKAVKNAGKSPDKERKWQNEQLPPEIRELVLATRHEKEKVLKI